MAIKFNSLNSIIDDIFAEIRNNNISESDRISPIQVEQWIHQYRALLLKQDIDKGRSMNESYIQHIYGIQMEKIDQGSISGINSGEFRLRSFIDIPEAIDFNSENGVCYVSDIYGNEIQLSSEKRAVMQKHRKFTSGDNIAYIKDGKIWILGVKDIDFINIRGIFEVPPEVNKLHTIADENPFSYDDPYPIPANMIPILKSMIFKGEFGIMLPARVDNTNDASDNTENDQDVRTKTK